MVGIEITGGTAKHDQDLCATCANGTLVEFADGKIVKECSVLALKPNGRVVRCGSYRHKNSPDLYHLEKIAWMITSDPKGPVGFQPPKRKHDPVDEML